MAGWLTQSLAAGAGAPGFACSKELVSVLSLLQVFSKYN